MIVKTKKAMEIAKEALWLAWNACNRPFGMGVLQDNPGATKEEVWENAYNKGDYSGGRTFLNNDNDVDADYVFGRMMKLYFKVSEKTIDIPERECQSDYQSWCTKYPTYKDLFEEAAKNVGEELNL